MKLGRVIMHVTSCSGLSTFANLAHAPLPSVEREKTELCVIQPSADIMAAEENLRGFDKLLAKNVPHIIEGIFFYLDYLSFKTCLRVSKTWYELLTTDSMVKKARASFREGLLEDEKRLCDAASRGDALEIRVVIQWWC